MSDPGPRVIVALDFADSEPALDLSARLDPRRCRLKVGKQLFTRAGPDVVARLQDRGFEVFLDLKFHDIPNTVRGACRAGAELGVWMIDVHACGGRGMLEAAREGVDAVAKPPLLIGVTVLTSLDAGDLEAVGVHASPEEQVVRLATLGHACGLDGVVCSPQELALLAQTLPAEFVRVTPGVRPAGGDASDQKRIATPARAIADGAHYLVIGRPITAAPDPGAALEAITAEIGAAT
ncbi:MAG: orotidine-5'-phosphate decarboxylase [Gammaproteobacteria bacterium]|nr:orotidine-5'-phosphate decarboxylase [Gammaproteobacteria bacterium]